MSVDTETLATELDGNESVVDAVMKTHRRWSPIWFLPVLAVIIMLWLMWQSWLNQGLTVFISFPTGEGMAANETKVRYKGIPVGVVKRLSAQKEHDRVLAEVLFQPDFARFDIPADTQFWLVQPQISLQGVSGLSTLLTGNYLAIALGTSEETAHEFDARTGAPPLNGNTPGLHIRLRSGQLASVNVGSPVFYREIAIGSVQAFALAQDKQGVVIDVNIAPEHAALVHKNSRFWNASGVQVNAGLSGINVRTGSLMSMLFGGIAMADEEKSESGTDASADISKTPVASNGDEFVLHADYENARAGLSINIAFASAEGLQVGSTRVVYKGLEVGKLRDIQMRAGKADVVAQFGVDPRLARYITERTRFWLVRPGLNLNAGVDSLLRGGYVTFTPNDSGKASRDFIAHNGPDLFDFTAPGLHVLLQTETLNGLAVGAPVFHRELRVGAVHSVGLDRKDNKLYVHVLIDADYTDYIQSDTRFWNSSGFKLKADLSGVEVQAGPLLSLLGGGISFDTPFSANENSGARGAQKTLGNGQHFVLHADERSAAIVAQATLSFDSAQGLQAGATKVMFRGREIGRVEKVEAGSSALAGGELSVRARVGFNAEGATLLREGTQFWLQEASMNTGDGLAGLLAGATIQIKPGKGAPATEFVASRKPPAEGSGEPGLDLMLLTNDASGVSVGAPLLYKQLNVGRVTDVALSMDGRRVQILVHIEPEHAGRIRSDTRFWRAGGVQVEAGLQGLSVKAGRLDAIWQGGIAFDRLGTDTGTDLSTGVGPDAGTGKSAHSGDQFALYRDQQAAALDGFTVHIRAPIESGLMVASTVRWRGQVVGEVAAIQQDAGASSSLLSVRLLPALANQVGAQARFWLVKPALGLARTANLEALTGNYIGLQTSAGVAASEYALSLNAPAQNRREGALNLRLSAARLGSTHAGDPVLYRQIKVGEVLGAELDNADKVSIFIAIEPRYAPLLRRSSRFWRASGIAVEAGLFSGVQVQTESLETIIAGGIAFATPEDHDAELAKDGESFNLADEADEDWLEWAPQIRLPPE